MNNEIHWIVDATIESGGGGGGGGQKIILGFHWVW